MNQREMALLEIFLNHPQTDFLSSRLLAQEMGLSDRTVRKVTVSGRNIAEVSAM